MSVESALRSRALKLALSPLLVPAMILYAAGSAVHRALGTSRRRALSAPVISVGNLTVGGTGKTPVLLRLLSDLTVMGRRPSVLTRGYSGIGQTRREGIVSPGGSADGYSDEVRLMATRWPGIAIGVGADRVASAMAMRQHAPDVFVLDDGFQQWSIRRELDIVCVDASQPWERFLLPFGLLREPAKGIRRSGIVLLTRCELADGGTLSELEGRVRELAPDAEVIRTGFDLKLVDPDNRAGATGTLGGPCVALSAIGNPASFERALTAKGFEVTPARFLDHHPYTDADLAGIESLSRRLGAAVITTEKDWVKLRETRWASRSARPPLRVAEQTLVFHGGGEEVWKKVLARSLREKK